jgi:hypothetical protein
VSCLQSKTGHDMAQLSRLMQCSSATKLRDAGTVHDRAWKSGNFGPATVVVVSVGVKGDAGLLS